MIKVRLTFPGGAVFETETLTVAELATELAKIDPAAPVFLLDKARQGKIPVRSLGPVVDPDVNPPLSFQIETSIDLE